LLDKGSQHELVSIRFMMVFSIVMGAIVAGAALVFSSLSEFYATPIASLVFGLCLTLSMVTAIVCLQGQSNQDRYEIGLLQKSSLLGLSIVALCLVTLISPKLTDFALATRGIEILVNASIVYLSVHLTTTFLQVHGKWPNPIAGSLTSLYLLAAITSIAVPGLAEEAIGVIVLACVRDFAIVLTPVAIVILSAMPSELRLSPHGLMESLRLRWTPSRRNRHELCAGLLLLMSAAISGSLLSLAAVGIVRQDPILSWLTTNVISSQLSGFSFVWLGALWYGLTLLIKARESSTENLKVLKLINPATRKFMFRHRSDASY